MFVPAWRHLLTFSADSRAGLVARLRQADAGDLGGVARASIGPPQGPHRAAIVAASADEFDARRARLLAHLDGATADRPLAIGGVAFCGVAPARTRIACMFPGLGIRQTQLTRDLDLAFPLVDDWVERLSPTMWTLASVRIPVGGGAEPRARRSEVAALGEVLLGDLAMWVLLRSLGLQCDAVVGHSFGENALLVAAGMVDDYPRLSELLRVVLEGVDRSRYDEAPLGTLAVTAASRPLLAPLVDADSRVFIALDNCPQQLVVCGPAPAVDELERQVRNRKQVAFRLPALDLAVHTPLFPGDRTAIGEGYAAIPLAAPRMPAWSTVTSGRFPSDPDAIRDLLVRQWWSPVRFREVIERLHEEGVTTFLEVGPGDHLSGFVRDTLRGKDAVAIATHIEGRDSIAQLLSALAHLFVRGHDFDFQPIVERRRSSSDREAIAAAGAPAPVADAGSPMFALVAGEVAALLGLPSAADVEPQTGFFDLGLKSIGCVELADRLSRALGREVAQTMPFEHPTVTVLAAALTGDGSDRGPMPVRRRTGQDHEIAVIGLGCRFPGGASGPDAYWQALVEGRDAIGSVPGDRQAPADYMAADPSAVRARAMFGGFLDDIRGFDPAFFGISPREALTLDPQQRLLLEVTWETIEHAGIDPRSLAGSRTGVFVGIANADYAARLSMEDRLAIGGHLATGNLASTAAGRVSFALGLNGPALAVDTACSSSLAAVHLAVESLRRGESDAAIAGGVNLLINPETTVFLSRGLALSPTGRCRTFDQSADGYVRGEGCGMVMLKRLADATAAGDRVLAVIHGTAMNHDGRTSGLTVPSGAAQQRVVRDALADAGCDAAAIGYVEAHGTGTPLGDPIELNALAAVCGGPRDEPLRLGSVKTNIGHLEAAAGVAALIKVALQHEHGQLVPSLHFEAPAAANWAAMQAEVVVAPTPWAGDEGGRRSGISSFGISGTNVHVVVGDPPSREQAPDPVDDTVCWLPLSARSDAGVEARARDLAAWLRAHPEVNLLDVARTLGVGRTHFARRRIVKASSVDEAAQRLERVAAGAVVVPSSAAGRDIVTAYLRGDACDWLGLTGEGPRVSAPTYPFERQEYWIDAPSTPRRTAPAATSARKPSKAGVRERLRAAAPAERPEVVTSYLQARVGAIMGAAEGAWLDAEQPLCEAGLDSLMALELSESLQRELGVAIAASAIVDRASVATLTRTVLESSAEVAAAKAGGDRETSRGPLSYGQRALWFLWKLAPESSAYNQSLPLSVTRGSAASWREAAGRLTARHPMLRTRLLHDGGERWQQVDAEAAIDWRHIDARGWDDERIAAEMAREHAAPFDLAAAPAIRWRWFDHGDRATLLVTMHHVACDGWSLELMRRELTAFADAAAAGGAWTPAPPERSYLDFVRWQREMVDSPDGRAHWDFWRETLAEPRARIDLPTDRPRPAVQTYRGASVRVPVPAALADRLQAAARSSGVTPYVYLLAGFLAVLYRWTRQRDLIIGTPAAGRTQPGFTGVVGYFVDPVVVRTSIGDGATFADVLAEAHRASRAALAHADFPFPLLVERLRVDRDPGRNPIFDVTFNFHSRRSASARGPEGLPRMLEMPQADGKFDLTLTVIEEEAGMEAALGFNTDLFDRASVESIGAALVSLFDAVTQDPGVAIDAVTLGAADEGRPVLIGRPLDRSGLVPVHHQMLRWAERTPEAVAVVADDGRLSYRELAHRAGELAAALRARGVGPDVPIGLCTPRTTDFIVGLLGILQAGGAFVPMPPELPRAARDGMIRQAGAPLVVEAGENGLAVSGPGRAAAVGEATLSDLAYVIFTSGSTGAPKGVAVEHLALANYVASIVGDLGIEPGARHAMVSTIGADLGHTVLVPALVTGGTLHLLGARDTTEGPRFADYLRRHEIDYLKIVPSHFAALAGDDPAALPRRALIFGGESTGAEWARRLARRSGCRVFNHYGPTETTVGVMTFAVDPDAPLAGATLPLTRPVANAAIWLLDPSRRAVPAGVPGEIYVSGAPLARGYINDPERTDERFVRLQDGSRAYRTGDLARVLSSGGIRILGREDRQLKIRGYRVEPEQVEHALAAHPGVRRAVVLPDADGAAASALVAFVVAGGEPPPGEASLREWLASRLPAYLVPSAIVLVPSIPLTANGKVDVRALRAQAQPPASRPAAIRAPRDPVEFELARIWKEVLGVAEAGPSDDFFDAGGHSLAAVRLVGRAHEVFGVDVPLAALFTHRRLEQLASFIRAAAGTPHRGPVVCLQAGTRGTPPLVCVPGAGGSLVYFHELLAALGSDVPVWGAQALGLSPGEELPATIPALADAYEGPLRALAAERGPVTIAGHSFGALVGYELARRLGGAVATLVVLDNEAPGGQADDGSLATRDWGRHIATRIERLYDVDLALDQDPGVPTDAGWLIERLLAAGVLPPDARREDLQRYVALYEANARAAAAYRPERVPIDGSILVCVAAQRDAALGEGPSTPAPALGWEGWSVQAVDTVTAPGTHITMLRAPAVADVAGAVKAAWRKAEIKR